VTARVRSGRPRLLAATFLAPALLLLGALVLYPIAYSVGRSLFDADGRRFVGLANYAELVSDGDTFIALRNNAVWVLVGPAVVTGLGLVFAVLTERVRWGAAVKLVVFLPMAISMLAAGIIFTLVYQQDPGRGLLNAVVVGVHDSVVPPSPYPTARARDGGDLVARDGGYEARAVPGRPVLMGLVGVAPRRLPPEATSAAAPTAGQRGLHGVVWLDVTPGGGGRRGAIDPAEKAMPDVAVQAVRDGAVVASTRTGPDGHFAFGQLAGDGYTVRLAASNFTPPFRGVTWLGPGLVTPAIIAAYAWMWSGFAMVLIAAGLAALPREVLEAARVDGASEWQVFRRVTMPLLAPVLLVVLITLVINVLKVFDLVYVIAPGAVQQDANVLALQMSLVSFGGGNDQGLGSAIAVFLLLLVLPVMAVQIRRVRREQR
jgi:ABC-type sugar transport system permease subunit